MSTRNEWTILEFDHYQIIRMNKLVELQDNIFIDLVTWYNQIHFSSLAYKFYPRCLKGVRLALVRAEER